MNEVPSNVIFSMGSWPDGIMPKGFEHLRRNVGNAKYFKIEHLGNVFEVSRGLIQAMKSSKKGFEKALSKALPFRIAFKRFDANRDLYIYRVIA